MNKPPIQLLLDEEVLVRLMNCSQQKNIRIEDLIEDILIDYFTRIDREKEIKQDIQKIEKEKVELINPTELKPEE